MPDGDTGPAARWWPATGRCGAPTPRPGTTATAFPGSCPMRRARTAEVAVCVPFTALWLCADKLKGSGVLVFAQNMHHEPEGRLHR